MAKRISVLLFTYNHEAFVEQCIASILKQSNHHEIEIIWHDDCSTDATVARAEAALKDTTVQVKKILRSSNRFQSRIPVMADILELAEGEFIAFTDGDDFWCNENKLKMQTIGLDTHQDIDLCFARTPIVTFNGELTGTYMGNMGDAPARVPTSNVIRGDGGFMHTGAILMRKSVFDNAPKWMFEHQPVGDYMFQVYGSLRNGALYLPFDFSCWRSQNPNSFTGHYDSKTHFQMEFEAEFLGLLRQMQLSCDQRFKADFDEMIFNHFVMLLRKAIPESEYSHVVKAAVSLNFPKMTAAGGH